MKKLIGNGFTLIELLVVIAIIGVLTTMVASNFQTSRIKANDARRKSDLTQIQKALEMYASDHGAYPLSNGTGQILGCGAGSTNPCAWGSAWQDANGTIYMSILPADIPSPEFAYRYVASSDQRMYQIYSVLQNSNDGSNDSIIQRKSMKCGSADISICSYGVSSQNTDTHADLNTQP